MTLKEQMQSDFDNIFLNADEFAEAVTYRIKATGLTKTINVIINYEENEPLLNLDGEYKTQQGDVEVSKTDIPSPQEGDTITNSAGDLLYIERKKMSDLSSHILEFINKKRKTVGTLRKK